MAKLKNYDISLDVKHCEGYQTFRVKASSKENALDRFKNGEILIVESEVEVQSLADPTVDAFELAD